VKEYRIRDWDKHFENNRTRELKRLEWVPVPNKHDGDGFTDLLDHENGMAHYGAWHLILQVASKCDPRGTLLRDGAGGVKTPHTPQSLARITRGSAAVFEQAIERLITIGWIESYDNPAPSCGIPAPACGKVPMEWKGMEGKGNEEKGTHTPPSGGGVVGFEIFWTEYPKKVGKQAALKAWKNTKSKPEIADILQAIELQKRTEQWRKDGGQFIPNPATWINQGRWDDQTKVVIPRESTLVKERVKTSDELFADLCCDLAYVKNDPEAIKNQLLRARRYKISEDMIAEAIKQTGVTVPV
jgi:hypothetical protein